MVRDERIVPAKPEASMATFNDRTRKTCNCFLATLDRQIYRYEAECVALMIRREVNMPIYMYQAAYTPESWAAQLKNPQNRVETVGRQTCESVGGKMLGGWYCFGDYDFVLIADVPNNEAMSAIALAVAAGGAIKSSKTTVLMTGDEIVGALKKATAVASTYKPAR